MNYRMLLMFLLLTLAGCGVQPAAAPPTAVPTAPPVTATAEPTAPPPTAVVTTTPTAADVLAHTRIAYVQTADRASGEYDLYLMKPDGTDRRRLTDLPGIETSPAWSYDGRTLAFVATRDSSSSSARRAGTTTFTVINYWG